jgi:hypothetical protein
LLLKLIEIEAHDAPVQQRAAHELKQILKIFRNGIAILDEVDLILHPLKSELTFSLGDRCVLSQKHRYMIAEFLVRATFGYDLAEVHGDEHSQLKEYFKGMHKTYASVFRDQELVDPKSYSANFHGKGCLKQSYAQLLVCYLRFHFAIGDHLKQTLFEFIFEKRNFPDAPATLDLGHSECVAVAELCRVWCQELLPHILSKQHRVHYGLIECDNKSAASAGEDRFLKAVPFLFKELPSPDSEFSSMDVTFGFTALSFMKQRLRLRDVCGLVSYLQKYAASSDHMQAQKVLSTWRLWMGDSVEGREFWNLEAIDLQNTNATTHLHALVAQRNVFQLKQYYLLHIVFPAISSFSKESISADALDMTNMFSSIFGFSGTLTENVYPLSWAVDGRDFKPNLNDDDQTRMRTILCDSDHVNVTYLVQCSDGQWNIVSDEQQSRNFESSWKVQDLLEAVVTRAGISCLIDCGALVTGLSNDEVAKFLMNLKNDDPRFDDFRKKFSVCVFWDSSDAPVALERGASAVTQLSACSKPPEQWFVYFDHVHTTGIDLLLPRTAVAAVTIGSDTVLRDYQQACWRLRQLGLGQRVEAVLVPEIHRLFVKAASISDEVTTLQVLDNLTLQGGLKPRSLFGFLEAKQDKSESRQLLCLRMRELHVWRRRCFHGVIDSSNTARSKLLARKFVRTHNDDGIIGNMSDLPDSNDGSDADELQQFHIVDASIQCLLRGVSSPRSRSVLQHNWDALAVQQKQQQAQQEKEALRENPEVPFKDAPKINWHLSDVLLGTVAGSAALGGPLSQEPSRSPRPFREISKIFSFYPDFLYASQSFAAAFNAVGRSCVGEEAVSRYELPKVEIILEIKSRDASIAHKIVFVTLAEANTLFHMILTNSHHEWAEICTMHALDYHGYCSQLLPSASTYSDACREHLFSAPLRVIDSWFQSPSPLCVATAYARLLNCELNFDIYQGACIANALQAWGRISSHVDFTAAHDETDTIRDIFFASFRTLSSLRPVLAVDPLRSRFLCLVAGALSDPISSLSKMQRWQSAALTCMHLARVLSFVKIACREGCSAPLLDLDIELQLAWNQGQTHVDVLAAQPDAACCAHVLFGAPVNCVALRVIFDRLRPILVDVTLGGLADAFELVLQPICTIN